MAKEIIKEILMNDDVIDSINKNLDILINIIPEIKDMIGFEHNHPHHHLDVWGHTLLALSLSPKDFEIRLVLLLHDIGKPHSYQDKDIRHFKDHPKISSEIAFNILNRLNFEAEEISEMCNLINEHDMPISTKQIIINKELALKKFKIQFCDALAHNPTKLEKRISYLSSLNKEINSHQEQEIYQKTLSKFSANIKEKNF